MTVQVHTLYLPELREMLAEGDEAGLREFCTALHPARTAEYMGGLTAEESWAVLQYADMPLRAEIFGFLDPDKQLRILETTNREEIAEFVAQLPPDDRVDLLKRVDPQVVQELLGLLPVEERRDIQRLRAFPEETAGAEMTTDFARLSEDWTVGQALEEISRQAEQMETIYYLYVVDDEDHLRGLVSARQLVAHMGKPNTLIRDLMERDIVTVRVGDDQEEVARKVARYDLLAIPVVDDEHRLVGIITHDDVLDVMVEEAVEDAQRAGGLEPLEDSYLNTPILSLAKKRGVWLTLLFFGAFLTAVTLQGFGAELEKVAWLVVFLPLIVSTGGNSGSQSAALILTALATGTVSLRDWWRVVWRELLTGLALGAYLGVIGYGFALLLARATYWEATVVPVTLLLVVTCGTLVGSLLPLLFKRLGWDPAYMSNPFVAVLIDVIGILIYMGVAVAILGV
ncbi:MAG TPA: magnesium transporter [Planctomycetaceae bacterium]|nr:magnesium transporter [Planctomycetaceae bacterium]